MNCPRCTHLSSPNDQAYYCRNCGASFLKEGADATAEPLVRDDSATGNYEIRRRVGTKPGVWIGLALSFGFGVLVVRRMASSEWRPSWGFNVILLGSMFLLLRSILRDRFGRVCIEVNESGLTVLDGLPLKAKPTHVARERIDGFWVRGSFDEYGPTGCYALMIDEHPTKSYLLIAGFAELGPLVVLAEKLAAHLRVPSNTRGSDFR
jgi:hypothetical protein